MQQIHLQMLNFFIERFDIKKGRSFLLLPFFLFVISCASVDLARYGKVSLHNTGDSNSFVFAVNEEFEKLNIDSPKDPKNPKMTKAESRLLIALLKQKKYCLDKNNNALFTITSRQEKIYDMTFAHLIEQNYHAKPITPRMYFGQCNDIKSLDNNNSKK